MWFFRRILIIPWTVRENEEDALTKMATKSMHSQDDYIPYNEVTIAEQGSTHIS